MLDGGVRALDDRDVRVEGEHGRRSQALFLGSPDARQDARRVSSLVQWLVTGAVDWRGVADCLVGVGVDHVDADAGGAVAVQRDMHELHEARIRPGTAPDISRVGALMHGLRQRELADDLVHALRGRRAFGALHHVVLAMILLGLMEHEEG